MKKIVVISSILGLLISCSNRTIQTTPTKTVITPEGAQTVVDQETPKDFGSERTDGCPEGMVHVVGEYCPEVDQECLSWLPGNDPKIGPLRCAEFKRSVCKSSKRTHKDFCMDVYEYPNKKGELPPIGSTWYDAKKSCEGIGKRLCTATEWTFACEGPDAKPYPYGDGMHRDDTACNIDKKSMANPDAPRSEWAANYRAVPSGSMDKCVSWAGVHDMTGNVDEWVNNIGGRIDGYPYVSGLKGGYWGPVRARCRPMTDAHGPGFAFYQIGFRCCK